MTDSDRKQICDLRKAGMSYSRIASATGININSIKTYCTRNGLGGVVNNAKPDVTSKAFCQYCGEQLIQTPGRKKKRFCSNYCRNHYWNSHLSEVKHKAYYEYTCPVCKKDYTVYGNSKRKYCSHACYVKGRWGA